MPKRRIYSDPTAFRQLEALVKPYEASGRTKSAAFLIIYRLDETEAQDAVCDQRDDMGVDAVRVNDDSEEVVLFQAKRKEKIPSTLGDSDLKSFVGALTQFRTRESIEKLIAATENAELKKLLIDNKVAEKIERGYATRAIFVANVAADVSATRYLQTAQSDGGSIEL
jgi:alpha-glucuronidase